ncbi:MAG: hypothetical protein ACTHNM_17295 [Dyella sp.]|uniref:hypothetical protein n=1 Tax=Dyella sp. TaxID=1869338 RepID=UPI003F7F2365
MTLKLKKVETFKARVHLALLTGDADREQEASFVAEFKYLNRDQFDKLMANKPSDPEFVDDVLVGVSEVANDAGEPVSFEVAKAFIMADMGYCGSTVRTYIEYLGGAPAKNSKRSR